ncbi:MAG: AMP-binding protein [Endomicrobium sp.]|jgi:acyl-coenzyme A synthetase/AMP-(fatty) acid ligase|nr:AMP-binding protein [Endomicrobium sp.]
MWDFKKFKNNIAVISDTGTQITYKQLLDYSDTFMTHIHKRCLVFVLCSNTLGSLLGYVTLLNNKVVLLMLESDISHDRLCNLIDLYQPCYLWLPESKVSVNDIVIFKLLDYALIKQNNKLEYSLNDELALLLTTSGSTGSSKFVRQSYTNIKANTSSIVEYLKLDSLERTITTLPMNYTYGLSIINSHLYVGASIILTQHTIAQREFWNLFLECGATSFGGVPYTYEILDKLMFLRRRLPHLRTMTQAGGKLSLELHKKFAEYAEKNNKKFIVMYGQTEATARMSYLPAEKSIEKCGSIGIAIPGGKFSLIDADGNEVTTPETVGELIYTGANVTLGYAENGEDLSKGDNFNGKLMTGDMAKFDEDSFFYIIGRKKRFLKIFGNRVNLDDVEMLLCKDGIDCACDGNDDNLVVYVTNEYDKKKAFNFIVEHTSINRNGFKILIIDKIPRNEAGKILYSALP